MCLGLMKNRLLILFILPLILLSCSEKDASIRIQELIEEAAGMAEKHDMSGLMDLTTEDFQASPGSHGRREAKRVLWMTFRHYGDFRIHFPRPDITPSEDEKAATAVIYCLITEKDKGIPGLKELYRDPRGWLREVGERADLYRLKLEFLLEKGDWLVNRARVESFRGLGFE